MTPSERATKVDVADANDLKKAAQKLLDDAGVTLDELRSQAASSRFSSERARRAWFVISAVAELA